MKKYDNYEVALSVWIDGSGWNSRYVTHEWIDDYCTAEEWIKSLDTPLQITEGTDVEVAIIGYDDDDNREVYREVLSSAFVDDVR